MTDSNEDPAVHSGSRRYQRGTSPISVAVLTLDEEANIRRCLSSVAGWADQVVVVDSFSTDRTIDIAYEFTEEIEQHPFETHTQQWTWTLENVDLRNEWLLALDADFVVSPHLQRSIDDALSRNDPTVAGYFINRLHIFRGRPIRHGGAYPGRQLRLFRINSVFMDQDELADPHFYVRGKTSKLRGDLIEENRKQNELSFWIATQARLSARLAQEEIKQRAGKPGTITKPTPFGNHNQRVLWLKRIWVRLPLYWRSVFYFLYRYIFRLGFLDGRAGFLYHFCQSLLFRVALDARIEELSTHQVPPDPSESSL